LDRSTDRALCITSDDKKSGATHKPKIRAQTLPALVFYHLLAAVIFNQMKRQEIKQKIKECLQQFDGVDAPDDMVSETMFNIYGQELNAVNQNKR